MNKEHLNIIWLVGAIFGVGLGMILAVTGALTPDPVTILWIGKFMAIGGAIGSIAAFLVLWRP